MPRKPPEERLKPSRRRKAGLIAQAEKGLAHVAEALESRLLTAGQVATATTSAEVNLASAALEAIEGNAVTAAPARARRRPGRRPGQKARRRKSART